MDTEIWAARLDRELTAREQEALRFFLPPVRRERFLQMKALSGRREILCAYGLLRLLLYEKFGWRTLPRIAFLEYGKPWFPDYPRVQFNLSHTAGAVMVGLSEQPVGVDIEKIRPVSSRMMQRTFGTESQSEFFRRWVLLEAAGKRSGQGLASLKMEAKEEDLCRIWNLFPGYVSGVAVSPGCPVQMAHIFTIEGPVPE